MNTSILEHCDKIGMICPVSRLVGVMIQLYIY